MYEEIDKQDSVESVLSDEGGNDSVSVDVSSGNVVPDVPAEDVSSGNVFNTPIIEDAVTGSVDGNISGSGEALVCSCVQKPLLWESDINEYDTTDGLLLLILIFTILNTARGWFVK